jgi:hypothetical protein
MRSPLGSWSYPFADTASGKQRSFLRTTQSEPALADPGRAGQRDHAGARQQPSNLAELWTPPDEAGELDRRVSPGRRVTAVVMTQPNLKGRTTPRCPSGSSVPAPKRPRTPCSPEGLPPPGEVRRRGSQGINVTRPHRAGHRAHRRYPDGYMGAMFGFGSYWAMDAAPGAPVGAGVSRRRR